MYKRLSQISGVPVLSLMPERKVIPSPASLLSTNIGTYYHHTHAYELKTPKEIKRPQIETSITTAHEQFHALQRLVSLSTRKPIDRRIKNARTTGALPIETNRMIRWYENTNPRSQNTMRETPLSEKPTIINFRKYVVQRHGIDGVLLLWADLLPLEPVPVKPEKMRELVPSAFKVRLWERQMVQKETLQVRGGFTRKGLRYFREKVSAAGIWEFLADAEKRRKASQGIFQKPEKKRMSRRKD
ncbi:hypothetical protein KKE06_03725 [Candidatus Micrarchaeota archaeon]|nr:hypothetical protein [Candidatus Micrarchaeota archaeon]